MNRKMLKKIVLSVSVLGVMAMGAQIEVNKGWNLLGSLSDVSPTTIGEKVQYVWVWDKEWKLYSKKSGTNNYGYSKLETIKKGVGFWAYSDIAFKKNLSNTDSTSKLNKIGKGWNLLGALSDITPSSVKDAKYIWGYQNGWKLYCKKAVTNNYGYEKLATMKEGFGFWIYNEDSSKESNAKMVTLKGIATNN